MGLSAGELRRRAREDLQEVAKRREAVAVAAVALREEADRARRAAETAASEATAALAAAAVTFGGPEQAERVTGIPAQEFRSARRDITAEKATETAEALYAAQTTGRKRGKRGQGSGAPDNGASDTEPPGDESRVADADTDDGDAAPPLVEKVSA